VLVFEPEHGGHQPAYVRMLAEWIAARGSDVGVTFAVSGQLLERLQVEDRMDLKQLPGVTVYPIDTVAAQACFQGPLYRRSFARMRLIRQIVTTCPVRHVVALYLDSLQLSIALGQHPGPGTTLSGILFRPSLHAIYSDSDAPPLNERIRDWRKRILYRLMLHNPALTRVFSLDPYFPAYAASEFASAEKVVGIADPAVSSDFAEGAEIGPDLREALEGQTTTFALFGALSERKGVCQVLDAVHRLTPATRERIRVVLAGRVDSSLLSEVRLRADRLASPGIGGNCLRILDRYLTTAELAWLVRESSVILAPYQRFVGSSGVLTWAAAQRRPVIAQQYGLVGALVRDYRLGLAVDTSDPARIAESIADLAEVHRLQDVVGRARWSDFLAGRTGDEFAARLLGEIVERGST
jgi:glycosyltransferase involved in cell wall biosynthesis